MQVKRMFTHDTGQPVFSHLKIMRHGKVQNFTQKFINRGMQDGFLTMSKGEIIIHAQPKDLTYKIVRVPGYYCCHDDAPVANEREAREYIEKNHKGKECDDPNNPSGYRKDNFYHCELVEAK